MVKPILVGDIGSTKSTWWYGTDHPVELQLQGYNPFSHPESRRDDLFRQLHQSTAGISFDSVWYYGAGIVDEHISGEVRSVLGRFYPNANVHVHSDLIGACFAACGTSVGTVAILGTGSHAAIWDGHAIIRQANSLGYILGDEGGGCDIGKSLIQAYFYNEMPEPIHSVMKDKISGTRSEFLREFLANEAPNQFLADFAKVAVINADHPWIAHLISSRFDLFIKRHLIPLKPEGDVHVVGSIGSIFTSLISRLLNENGLSAGSFIKDPARRLFERHYAYGKK
jgi:N-acetylglucosamine kinase-like BadF-type ATPase